MLSTRYIEKLPSGNNITVNGIEIPLQVINGVAVLRPTQEQMLSIFKADGNIVIFDLQEYSAVDIYIDVECFRDVDKIITFITNNGSCDVNTKALWNNSGKQRLITVRNNKLSFTNM